MIPENPDLLTMMPPAQDRAGVADGYLMIESIRARNFRCYKDLKVTDLSRVNVIVGENGTGKTALLESVFLASGGSPELGLRLQNFRGMGSGQEVSTEGLRGLWRDLFFDFDQSKPAEIALVDTKGSARSLLVSLGTGGNVSLPIEEFEGGSALEISLPIDFTWNDQSAGPASTARPRIENGRLVFPPATSVSRVLFFPSHFRLNPEEGAKRLSQLSKLDELDALNDFVSAVYPEIGAVSVENIAGSWQLFVKVQGRKERMPLALHSAGASKFIAILLGIASKTQSCVLIDEIENGFYFRKFTDVWKAFHSLAKSFIVSYLSARTAWSA